ncbi:hypothetical protein L914_13907 [Phytophthora nicotianae]|uniref:Uncharacterized protein n=1 Tax=Phytophthora nicotianae TaxID=4792 RepID=W2MX52_PHYNI|nr:hypothetical protein L914_13907 [Phytophthora nicotianae]
MSPMNSATTRCTRSPASDSKKTQKPRSKCDVLNVRQWLWQPNETKISGGRESADDSVKTPAAKTPHSQAKKRKTTE